MPSDSNNKEQSNSSIGLTGLYSDIIKECDEIERHSREIQSKVRTQQQASQDAVIAEFFQSYKLPQRIKSGIKGAESVAVLERLKVRTIEKCALGHICVSLLNDMPDAGEVFFESGSTPALAALGLAKSWISKLERDELPPASGKQIKVKSNNPLVQSVLHDLCEPRLLYGDMVLAPKYFGYFPVSVSDLDGINDSSAPLDLEKRLIEAFRKMCDDASRFNPMIMTSSKFHFAHGPFVGSRQNAFLKAAFFSVGTNIAILLDAEKVLTDDDLESEKKKGCIKVFDFADSGSGFAERSPCVNLNLVDAPITKLILSPRQTWSDTILRTLKEHGGAVKLFIAMPSDGEEENEFRRAVDKAYNEFASMSDKRLTLVPSEELRVNVDPDTWEVFDYEKENSRPIRILPFSYLAEN